MQWKRCSHLSTREWTRDQREIPSYLWQLGNSIEPKVKGLVENIHDTPHSRPPPLAHIARWLYLFNVSFNKTEACVSFHINRFKEFLFEATSQLTEIDLLASGGPSIKQPIPPINTFPGELHHSTASTLAADFPNSFLNDSYLYISGGL